MKPWLAKNWIGLAAVAVLLPATLGLTFAQQWTAYFENWPSQPVEVGQGETATYAGTGWTLESTERIPAASSAGAEIGLPRGTDLLVARVRVEPDELDDGESPFCTVRLHELRGDDIARQWGDAAFDPIHYRVSDDAESICASELTTPYVFEARFVVPVDAGSNGQLGLTLSVVEEIPDFLRFTLAN